MDMCPGGATRPLVVSRRGMCRKLDKTYICYNRYCEHWSPSSCNIYFGYPIDNNDGSNSELITKIVDILSKYGTIYDPGLAFSRTIGKNFNSRYVRSINDFALVNSDIAVFVIDPRMFTVGIILEIEKAVNEGIHTIIYFVSPVSSLYLEDLIDKGNIKVAFNIHDLCDLLDAFDVNNINSQLT